MASDIVGEIDAESEISVDSGPVRLNCCDTSMAAVDLGLGPVHTNPQKLENASFFLRFGLPPPIKRRQRKRSPGWRNLKTPAIGSVMYTAENGASRRR